MFNQKKREIEKEIEKLNHGLLELSEDKLPHYKWVIVFSDNARRDLELEAHSYFIEASYSEPVLFFYDRHGLTVACIRNYSHFICEGKID